MIRWSNDRGGCPGRGFRVGIRQSTLWRREPPPLVAICGRLDPSTIVLRPLFEERAPTVLAALIIVAMSGMIDIGYLVRLWAINRTEFALAMLAVLGVLAFGLLPVGVIAVVFALVILVLSVGRSARAVLGSHTGRRSARRGALGGQPVDSPGRADRRRGRDSWCDAAAAVPALRRDACSVRTALLRGRISGRRGLRPDGSSASTPKR